MNLLAFFQLVEFGCIYNKVQSLKFLVWEATSIKGHMSIIWLTHLTFLNFKKDYSILGRSRFLTFWLGQNWESCVLHSCKNLQLILVWAKCVCYLWPLQVNVLSTINIDFFSTVYTFFPEGVVLGLWNFSMWFWEILSSSKHTFLPARVVLGFRNLASVPNAQKY